MPWPGFSEKNWFVHLSELKEMIRTKLQWFWQPSNQGNSSAGKSRGCMVPQPLSCGLLQMNIYRLGQLSAGLSPQEGMILNMEVWFHPYYNCRKQQKEGSLWNLRVSTEAQRLNFGLNTSFVVQAAFWHAHSFFWIVWKARYCSREIDHKLWEILLVQPSPLELINCITLLYYPGFLEHQWCANRKCDRKYTVCK